MNIIYKFKNKPNQKIKPENPESEISGRPESRFVVHERKASNRTIYNFAMEMKDEQTGKVVLKTWTVPKNLPFEAETKHLAIQIEDQAVGGSAFEKKVIGDVAGGQIRIWDQGHWGLLQGKISEGNFSFNLFGEKIKGRFGMMIADNFPENEKKDSKVKHWLIWKKGL